MAKPSKDKAPSEEIQLALKSIVDSFENEDRSTRERQIRLWKKLDYYWSGYQRIWWDDVAHDWRIWNDDVNQSVSLNEAAYYDKPINVFRAYLESIIAALSATVPPITCTPDDADNPLDISTARGGSKIAELIFKHNDAPLLWCKALFIYCTQGMIAAYNYSDERKEYGLVEVDEYEDKPEDVQVHTCPNCGAEITPDEFPLDEGLDQQQSDMYGKDDSDVPVDAELAKGALCMQCEQIVNPNVATKTIINSRLVGRTSHPKTRQKISVDGGLFVRVPNYARTQDDTPYISYCYETHFTNVLKKYPHLRDSMGDSVRGKIISSGANGTEMYERWGRLNTQYLGTYPLNTPTCRNWWLRPQAFEFISDEDVREKLYKLYPDGCKVVFVNDTFAEACNQCLDDCWTLTYNPLSEYLSFDPLGMLLTSVQEITNDLNALLLQNIEHSIPQTFANKDTLNFKQYAQTEVTPGAVYPVAPKAGANVGDSFYTIATASFPTEAMAYGQRIQEQGEFVSGAQPAIFGGALPSSARTAAQYNQSKNQALQRLQTPWKMINYWWKNIFGKVIPAYIKTMKDDERIVRKVNNNYINDTIRVAELQGKIGNIELEASDELPQSFAETRDVITNLMQLNNPQVLAILGNAGNLEKMREALGMTQFAIPGEESREKQYAEIQLLVQNGPIETGMNPMDGSPQMEPTIMPEFIVDDHAVEIEVCQLWLRSTAGQLAKTENKQGYDNVVAHLQVHMTMHQQIQGAAMGTDASGNPNGQEKDKQKVPQQEVVG